MNGHGDGNGDDKRHSAYDGREHDNEANEGRPSALSRPDAEAPIDSPEPFTELENLYAENAALKEKALRAMAEAENVRRRAEREVADAKLYGVANFAREMLAFADNLRRAVESVPAETRATLDPAIAALVEGVEVTEKDFLSRLARFGVKKIDNSSPYIANM